MPILGLITAIPVSISFDFELGGAVPVVQTPVISVSSLEASSGYSNLFLEILITSSWLQPAIQGSPLITSDEQDFNVDYSIVEIEANKLSVNTYNTVVVYQVKGENNNTGGIDTLLQYSHDVSIKVTNADTVSISPKTIDFSHTIGNAIPTAQVVTLNGPNWTFETPVGFLLKDSLATITQNADGSYKATGNGSMEVSVQPQISILNSESEINYSGIVKDASGVVQDSATITVRVIADDTYNYTPGSLDFTTIKNASQAATQTITINSALAFTVTKPSWLLVSPLNGQNNVSLTVQPDPASGLDAGSYDGDIIITRTVNGSPVDSTIPVHYEIIDFIKLPGLQGDFWFTLDNNFMEVFTAKTNTYFQLTLTAILNNFYDASQKTIVLPYKIPLFQNNQKFNIGKIVDRLMYRLENYDDLSSQQYKPAQIELYVEEKEMGTDTVLQTILLSNIKYVAGYTPEKILSGNCFLDLYDRPTRVTKNSFHFLSYLLKTGNYTLKLLKNGGWISDTFISAAANHHIYTRKIDFSDFEQGDVLQYQIAIGDETLTKTFLMFPENKESYHIVWEDDYKLKTAMEFTGAFKITNNIENILQKSYQNDVEFTEKISALTEGTFTGSTGFILKADQVKIEGLMRSKYAWLILPEGTVINIVPIDKSLSNIDSERELYAFNVEFNINKDHDAQNYSF